jgi:hypothetical protein
MRPRRRISVAGIIVGLILGIGIALYIAWEVAPLQEVDTQPWQLRAEDRDQYIVAIALAYSYDGDVNLAVRRLLDLRLPGDPIQAVADVACRLATSGFVDSSSGLRAVRSMMTFYQLQGRSGCADTLIPAEGDPSALVIEVTLAPPTPTLEPPETKTATPSFNAGATPTSVQVIVPTSVPRSDFELISVNTVCSTQNSGNIQVFVYELNGSTGVPGVGVRVRWSGGENTFFTGLKPEFGPAYADFAMTEGRNYIIDLPGRSDPIAQPLSPVPCTTDTGERALTTYRVVFRRVF